MNRMYKVLVLCPSFNTAGGVATYYTLFDKYFTSDRIIIEYYFVGTKSEAWCFLDRIVNSMRDLLSLCTIFRKHDLVHLNPSLDPKAIIRDGVYHFIAKRIYGKKTIVFFHGWQIPFEKFINKRFRRIFRLLFNFDLALVLANSFKNKLISWGYSKNSIEVETTAICDDLLNGFSIENRFKGLDLRKWVQLLFLARIEKEKGVLETVEAFQRLSERYPRVQLVIAGDGPFMDKTREFVNEIGLKEKVALLGYVRGEEKQDLFLNSDIYILPTYREGMPTSVLEAMAFGLPVVTRPVGGLKDIFIDGKHGFLTESRNPEVFASLIEKLILDKELRKKIGVDAHKYVKNRFMASKVSKRLEDIYMKTVKN
jgi:glycosyltransferase involved in cell wall biosynthesis